MVSDKRIYQLIPPKSEENLPILFESPHSGTFHPEDGDENQSEGRVYPGVDRYVHQLFDFAPQIGAPLLYAEFCRCYIDPNRALDDMRPEWFNKPWPEPLCPSAKSQHGIGLIWSKKDGEHFSHEDVQRRIDEFYLPYHEKIRSLINELKNQHGHALHVSCHSAPHSTMKPTINPRINYAADIVISDGFGHTADARLGKTLRKHLSYLGYKVLSNDPFQGDELINANGVPNNNIHSIQIEINRRLYMNESSLKIHDKKFGRLKSDLKASFVKLSKHILFS